jgi:hypothetical protein
MTDSEAKVTRTARTMWITRLARDGFAEAFAAPPSIRPASAIRAPIRPVRTAYQCAEPRLGPSWQSASRPARGACHPDTWSVRDVLMPNRKRRPET